MLVVLWVGGALGLPVRAHAAPPGAERIDRGRYTVIHYRADAPLAAALLAGAVARDSFPWLPRANTRILIMLAPDAAVFREWAGGAARPWTAALAFVQQHRIVMQSTRARTDAGDPLQVMRHELAHIALFDYLGGLAPRWFDEGYASYAAAESRTDGLATANLALLFRPIPALAELDAMLTSERTTDALAGYALSRRAVGDLAALDPERGLGPLLVAWKERERFDLAMRRAYALPAHDFERRWQSGVRWRFALPALIADSALIGALALGPLIPVVVRRRSRRRRQLAVMRELESTAEQLRRSAVTRELVDSLAPEGGTPVRDA